MAGEETEVAAYIDANTIAVQRLNEEIEELTAATAQLPAENDNAHEAVEESSTMEAQPEQDEAVTYSIMEGLSQRGHTKLVDSRGFTYSQRTSSKKKGNGDTILWRCSVRNNSTHCLATVSQQGLTFRAGRHQHCHVPKRGVVTKLELHKRIKQCAKKQPNLSGSAIVNEIISETGSLLSLPKQAKNSMARLAHRATNQVRKAQLRKEEFPLGATSPAPENTSENGKHDYKRGGKRHQIILESSPGLSKRLGQLGGIADIPALTQSAETQRDILSCLKELVAVSKHRSDIEEQRLRIETRRLEIEEQRNARSEQDRNGGNIVWEVKGESDNDS